MNYFLIEDDTIVNLIIWDGSSDIGDVETMTAADLPDATIGWKSVNGTWTSPDMLRPIEDVRAEVEANITARRWQAQQTVSYNGATVPSDDLTIGRITAFVVGAQASGQPNPSLTWKFGPNDFRTITLSELVQYGLAISQHVQSCFIEEGHKLSDVAAMTSVADLLAYDITAGLPIS